MDKFHQELFEVLTRSRNVIKRESKAASTQQPEMITICKKEHLDLKDQKCANVIKQVVRNSMAASAAASGINQAHVINDFLFR